MDWNQFEKGVFLVNLLGIIYDPESKKILIGRRENDPFLEELSWVFPGGRADYDQELEDKLALIIKDKAGLELTAEDIVFAKTYPEKREFLSIYYLCQARENSGEVAGGELKELKWVKPSEVVDYFTTSLHPKLLEYLKTLE